MRNVKLVLVCLVVASLLTAMSWFYSSRHVLGSVNRGFPFQFSYTPVIVNPSTRYNYTYLLCDLVFWWGIVLIMVGIVGWAIEKRNVVTYPKQEW